MIPMQVLSDIDNARNPMQLTRERLERAATENQFMNGKIAAIDVSVNEAMAMGIRAEFCSHIASFWTKHCVRIFPSLKGISVSRKRGNRG